MILSDLKTAAKPYYRVHGQSIPVWKETGWKKLSKAVLQCCAYALAIEETLGLEIDGIEIIVALPQIGNAQKFLISRQEMLQKTEKFKKLAIKFWQKVKH